MQPAIATTAPPDLWRIARWFICVLHDIFGGPDHIAQHHTLTRKAYTLLLSWLRVGEAMMRRLIAIEAAAFPARAAAKPRTTRPRTRRLIEFHPDKPDDWRVSFHNFTSTLRQAQRDGASESVTLSLSKGGANAPGFHDAWPLAERYESLIRAFNDPIRSATRAASPHACTPRHKN